MTRKKRTYGTRTLVTGYLEQTSSKVFEDFGKQVTSLIGNQHGIYALYKGERLYYIGLAGNLRNRLKQHLKDRHAGKWSRFSLYLVRKVDHIKELESIIMRVAEPKGNKARGRLPKAQNLRKQLDKLVREEQERQRKAIYGPKPTRTRKQPVKKKVTVALGRGEPALASLVSKGFALRAEMKGKKYKATVRRTGVINFGGTLYNSPSAAAKAALGRHANGWIFWRYRNKKGEWVSLKELKG